MRECRGEMTAGWTFGRCNDGGLLCYARWPVEGGATKVRFVCGGAVTKKDDGKLAEAITVEWMGG